MKKTTHRKAQSSKSGKTCKATRMEEEQLIHSVQFEMSESSESDVLEQTISALFGIPGVGKSKFVEQLGFAASAEEQSARGAVEFHPAVDVERIVG